MSIADDSKLNNPVKNISQFLDASIGSRSGVCQMMLSSDGFPEDDMSHLAIAEDATSPESQVRSEAFAKRPPITCVLVERAPSTAAE